MVDQKNFEAPAFTSTGSSRDKVTLPGTLFDGTVHMPAMHQAVKAFLANQRQGTASTKIRKYVIGGNQKPWKQKGTGRARAGSIRAPHWVGGGTVFGPHPRSYAQYVPRQVRALARKSAFNARARENAIVVIDMFDFDAPKTRDFKALIGRLGGAGRKVLVLTNGPKPNVFLSGRNLPNVHVMPYSDVSTYHILWSDLVLIEEGALGDGGLAGQPARAAAEAGTPAEVAPTRKVARAQAGRTKAAAKAPKTPRAAKRAAGKPAARKAAKTPRTKRGTKGK